MIHRLDPRYYVHAVLPRWGGQAVPFYTLVDAEVCASQFSQDAAHVNVYDCSTGPVGVLVARFVRGGRVEVAAPRADRVAP